VHDCVMNQNSTCPSAKIMNEQTLLQDNFENGHSMMSWKYLV
jgi:hypothetical protein